MHWKGEEVGGGEGWL